MSLRHGISEQGKPEIQSEQATDKGQRHDIFQPVFDQEDGDEECRQNRVEKAANRQAFGGICAERTPVAMQHLHTCLSRYVPVRSEEHTYELQSLVRISYAVFCL